MEERLLHFMKWMQKQKQVVPYALQENDFLNNAEMEKLIVEYVEEG